MAVSVCGRRYLRTGRPLSLSASQSQQNPTQDRTGCIGYKTASSLLGGRRKIKARLSHQGYKFVPAASTITAILRRNGLLDEAEAIKHTPFKRFEYDQPNQLWQMDFKGYFSISSGHCYPLTILDDHSRFSIGIRACTNEKRSTVKNQLTQVFRTYGLPERFLVDNGSPWGSRDDFKYTKL